jgi:hypothetical protein
VLIKPFGYAQLDDGPKTPESAVHTLKTTVGKHQLKVGCDFCQETVQDIEVTAGGPQRFAVAPQLKPSALSFDYDPPDAVIRIGRDERPAKETLRRPFVIDTPQGPKPGRHHVEYEISHPGRRTLHEVAEIEPGRSLTLAGRLPPLPE